MQIINRITKETELVTITNDLTQSIKGKFTLGFLWISAFSKESTETIAQEVRKALEIECLLGCSCSGIIGTNNEVEQQPGCSLTLVQMDGVSLHPFYIDQSGIEQLRKPKDWYNFFDIFPNEKPNFIILPDPFQVDLNQFLEGINQSYPDCPVVGGLASGGFQSKENTLICNDQLYDEGIVGIHLTGNVRMETVVSQGCRPIGETYIVTKADGNVIYELAGKPLYKVLEGVLTQASARERALAQEAIFVGIAMDEYKHDLKRGDFLIRMLMGIDKESGAGAIADYVQTGQTIDFQIRDAVSATEDLNQLLKSQQNKHPHTHPQGALVFSCNGRGEGLFREKNHDIGIIQQHIGQVPVGGFFCAGEIGPVGGKNFVHGFTSSIALFYPENEN